MINATIFGFTFKCFLISEVSILPVYSSPHLSMLDGVVGPVPTNFNKTVT